MARWKPGSRERLQGAALELFTEEGFESAKVADIAARAGVTERTFYRHFADKRDVLFAGAGELQDQFAASIAAAPSHVGPLEAIAVAIAGFDAGLELPRHYSRQRQAAIAASPELTERELIKFEELSAACEAALCRRGVDEEAARLAARAGITVFRSAYAAWVQADDGVTMAEIVPAILASFRRAVAAGEDGRR